MRKSLVKRKRVNTFWCSIYAHEMFPQVWNLGLIINKSRRASDDWYERRPNKRARKAARETRTKTLSELRACLTLVIELLKELPLNSSVFIVNDSERTKTLSMYVTRLGFTPVKYDDQVVWVLTAQKKAEVLRQNGHTN